MRSDVIRSKYVGAPFGLFPYPLHPGYTPPLVMNISVSVGRQSDSASEEEESGESGTYLSSSSSIPDVSSSGNLRNSTSLVKSVQAIDLLRMYRFMGQFCGRALVDSHLLDIPFSIPFLRAVCFIIFHNLLFAFFPLLLPSFCRIFFVEKY